MKFLLRSVVFFLALGLVAACSSTQGASKAASTDYSNLQSLDQVLRMQPGLNVQGSGPGTKVYIRGISTITLETQPLYIIDGVRIGTNYAMANNAVNVKDIDSIRVLSGKSETTIYGEQGNNGVIIIKTRMYAETGG